jgi:hypothetical protein
VSGPQSTPFLFARQVTDGDLSAAHAQCMTYVQCGKEDFGMAELEELAGADK